MFTNKIKITGMALLMALSLTACGGGNADDNPHTTAPSATASASATQTPSADKGESNKDTPQVNEFLTEPTELPTPEKEAIANSDEMKQEVKAKRGETVADIDVAWAISDHGDTTLDGFSFDAKDGAQFGLAFMQDLIDVQSFYQERAEGSDWEILSSTEFANRMDSTLRDSAKKNIESNGFFALVPSAHHSGKFALGKGKAVELVGIPTSKFNSPDVLVDSSTDKDILYVMGQREMFATDTDGNEYKMTADFWVGVIPSGDSWKVISLDWDAQSDQWKAVK